MSTRTSIRIGSLVDNSMKQKLPGYERVLEEYTNQYLLFAYRKPVFGHYFATVLFQAAKAFGGLTCEVGLSRTQEYPYYRYYDQPALGVGGFRARTQHILKNVEATTTRLYTGPESLISNIIELVSEAITSGNKLIEEAIPRIAEQYQLWQPLYAEWQEADKDAQPDPAGNKYPKLVGEKVSREILHNCLRSGRFDSFLGSKKFRYSQPDFLNCHVYLLAKALAFVEPPDPEEMKEIVLDPDQDPDRIIFDPIGALSGRMEQPEAIELSSKMKHRLPEWAFLRSFAALEAFYENPVVELSKVASTTSANIPAPEVKPVGISLDELYGDVEGPSEASFESGAAVPALADPLPPVEIIPQGRPDPFEVFSEYLHKEKKAKSPDPFDMLGQKLGL